MLKNLNTLINDCVENPSKKCYELNIISKEEKELIYNFSHGEVINFEEKTIIELMKENLSDNIAIRDYDNNSISYNELDQLTDSYAYNLYNDYNIKKGDKIAILLNRTYNYPIILITLIKLGAIIIPLDYNYPSDYINDILLKTNAKFLISEKTFNDKTILIKDLKKINRPFKSKCNLNDIAYIMFTSGTTGKPKGVKISHRSLVNFVFNTTKVFNYNQNSKDVFFTGFNFIPSFNLYTCLANGSEFIIASQNDTPSLIKLLEENHIHTMAINPELGLYLYNNFNLNLDYLCILGSKPKIKNSLKKSKTKIFNIYGTTETCGFTLIKEIKNKINIIPAGKPISNTNVFILDSKNNPLPIGAYGEIVISSKQLFDGYFNSNLKENEFHTGDQGYFNFEGDVVILDRIDSQLNFNGFRIEPSHIEKNLENIPEIDKTFITIIDNDLVAYYITKKKINKNEIEKKISLKIPQYMIPTAFIELNEFPKNINGKIDKNQLPKPQIIKNKYEKPTSKTEKNIVELWEKILDKTGIGINDDFYNLGGNSLKAVEFTSHYNNLFLNDFMNLRSPKKIAKFLEDNENNNISFKLIKKGNIKENMFFIPPLMGYSLRYEKLINEMDYKGNIYVIDDPKYQLSIEEIKNLDPQFIINKYYEEIKPLFNNGDIIIGFSFGGNISLLIGEKLTKNNIDVGKIILLDSDLNFESMPYLISKQTANEIISNILIKKPELIFFFESEEVLKNKLTKIILSATIDEIIFPLIFPQDNKKLLSSQTDKMKEIMKNNLLLTNKVPKLNIPILFIIADDEEGKVDTLTKKISSITKNYEIKIIDTGHHEMMDVDYTKISKLIK